MFTTVSWAFKTWHHTHSLRWKHLYRYIETRISVIHIKYMESYGIDKCRLLYDEFTFDNDVVIIDTNQCKFSTFFVNSDETACPVHTEVLFKTWHWQSLKRYLACVCIREHCVIKRKVLHFKDVDAWMFREINKNKYKRIYRITTF